MIKGSCLCGSVKYEIDGGVSKIIHCHCETCRKAHGSAFSSVVSVVKEKLIISGSENLENYESSPGKLRFFCRKCGTQIYAKRNEADNLMLRLGSVNSGLEREELAHIWVSDKAAWYEIDSNLPRYSEHYESS